MKNNSEYKLIEQNLDKMAKYVSYIQFQMLRNMLIENNMPHFRCSSFEAYLHKLLSADEHTNSPA